MRLVELKDCPDGQFAAVWLFNGKMWSDTVKIKNHEITEAYFEYSSDDIDISKWLPVDEVAFTYDNSVYTSLRIVINEIS